MPVRALCMLMLAGLLLAGCSSEPRPSPPLEDAYVGPFQLELLAELAPDAAVTAVLHHGERVEVIARRRRFAEVRTADGTEGWTDGRMLLTASQMAGLRRLWMNAGRLPSEGKATVYEALNIHTAPNRQAPSFYQLQEGNLVEVVAQQLVPRAPYRPSAGEEAGILPLNSYDPPGDTAAEGAPADDWSLVRLPDGRAGWALARMLVMAIPDDVAQYAEGHRITSYFSLGRVTDGGETRDHWLWTTLARGGKPYQFDSFRVFVWSRRRHRYETAYIQRNLVGYYPVEVEPPAAGPGEQALVRRFSLILREDNGRLSRRTYAFSGYRVRLVGSEPWNAPERQEPEPARNRAEAPATEKSFFDRLKEKAESLAAWFRRR